MVMHARKLPRLNDGYIDRNQAHQYEGNGKYSTKPNFTERYNDRIRESPTTSNSSNYGKTESPDTKNSPRCHNKSVYSQRNKEREHHETVPSKSPLQRDRVVKASGNGKDQQISTARRNTESTGSTHRTNHDRSHSEDKEKRIQVGDWSEHISSSGKKYYYNCKTEVSQWEKPKEWIDWEKQQGLYKPNESNRSKDKIYDRQISAMSNRLSEKHSSTSTDRSSHVYQQQQQQQTTKIHNELSHSTTISNKIVSSAIRNTEHGEKTELHSISGEKCDRYKRTESRRGSEASQTHDMDISPGSGDTPTSNLPEVYQPVTVSHSSHLSNQTAPQISQTQLLSPSQVTLANLPRLISQLAGTKGLPNLSELSPQDALRTIQQALQLTKQVTSLAQSGNVSRSPHASLTPSENAVQKSQSPSMVSGHLSHNSLIQNSHSQTPPTSHNSNYHSQYQHVLPPPSVDGKLDTERGHVSPSSDYSSRSSRHGSPTSSISSLHSLNGGGPSSLVSAVLKPVVPSLPPSLANYYSENYISHVTGWQADHAERQASRYSDEAHTLGSLNCTQVSAELKMARSLVRLAEIQATLQEQRIMFLRQQIKEIEDWKARNTFMPDT